MYLKELPTSLERKQCRSSGKLIPEVINRTRPYFKLFLQNNENKVIGDAFE